MTAPQSSEVDPEQLRAHASRLAAHADQLSSIGAALPGEMGAQSLGAFAQFITTGLGAAMTETMGAFAHASSTLDKVGDGMRRAADRYEHTDEGHADRIAGLEEGSR
ncbi:type VII secretion target [Amycolatopsis sp. YIM 10]|uniref:type VII secretion target n=1 Tax=Amycolatopsis sp. YIM 10 TaxID=2653857 RepID=UPI00129003B3|nr:type VII secretion target [Amycolatopsis sp. YIM 10]QFU91902.1 WXG domain conatining protein [Amycolatopsis sp. YIM 10]